jgi:hypothetical protein
MRGVIAALLLAVVGCTLTPTPKPVPVPGATCQQGCDHVYLDLDCGGHPIDVHKCRADCEDFGRGDPECLAGADSCSAARLCG